MEINKIYNEDCLETMSKMPINFCDIVITSPPYNYNLRINSGKYTKRSVKDKTKYNGYYTDDLYIDQYFEWQKKCINEMLRVTKNYVFYNIQMLTGNKVAFFKLLGFFSEQIKEVLIWNKITAEPAFNEGCLNNQFEFIIVFSKNSLSRKFNVANFEKGTFSNILNIPKNYANKHKNLHTACFPKKLPYTLIKEFTKLNSIIYDPFIGTGTTAKAAISLKRNYLGSEINKKYCEIITKELEPYKFNLFTNE